MSSKQATADPVAMLIEWVDSGEDPGVLKQWLRGGGDVAHLASEAPAYVRLLRLISEESQWPIREALARQAGALLAGRPDLDARGSDSKKILYNLLYLCAGLQLPGVLAAPLETIFREGTPLGYYDGISLRRALIEAVILNQDSSNKLREYWRGLLEGRGGDDADEYDGFRGMVNATDHHGEPDFPNIFSAFEISARRLAEKSNKQAEIQRRARYVERCYHDPYCRLTATHWIAIAVNAKLPRWAAQVLPEISDLSDKRLVTVWTLVLTVLFTGYQVVESFCEGAMVRIEVDEEAYKRLRQVVPIFESSRLQTVDGGLRAQYLMLNHIFIKLERKCELIKKARPLLLKEALKSDDTIQNEAIVKAFDSVSRDIGELLREEFAGATSVPEVKRAAECATEISQQPMDAVPHENIRAWVQECVANVGLD